MSAGEASVFLASAADKALASHADERARLKTASTASRAEPEREERIGEAAFDAKRRPA